MPRPAKPPMTLKEAKRAYKKNGIASFQYTASQMARADRQDAREEKRKKELDKERQRVENKRKREEKDQRERAARQKMLAEGRITVEDTWGKVTASQPRLNRFFGGKAVVTPVKRKIMGVVEKEDEDPVNDQTLLEVYNGQGQQKTATPFKIYDEQGQRKVTTSIKIYDEQEQKATIPTNTELSGDSSSIHDRAATLPPSPSSSAVTRECSSPLDRTKDVPTVAEDVETKEGLIESFTSIFNEIDDDDLIALVEEVEADISTPRTADSATPKNRTDMALTLPHDKTPRPSVNTDKRQRHRTSEVSSRTAEARGPPVTGMPPPPPPPPRLPPRSSLGSGRRLRDSIPLPPPPKIGPRPQTTNTRQRQTTQQKQGSSSKILPWNEPSKKHHYAAIPADDFGAPGPSTQALMVELVEQVEAQIDAHARR
ncbi:hypothetical protein LTR46_006895 [Exophiala xenobiotica]|nr:hypothetical protein LTR46_006895 [Exophiala xenobiotica]